MKVLMFPKFRNFHSFATCQRLNPDLLKQNIKITRESFQHLFRKYYQSLCSFARQYIDDRDVCEDAVQEAFTSLWDSRTGFNDEKAAKYYLYHAVRNKCLNIIRHDKVKQKHKDELSFPMVDEGVVEEGVYVHIYKALKELSRQECKVMLGVMHGYSNKEIAEDLLIAVNTVKTLRQRAYKSLRSKLKGLHWLLAILFA